MRLKEEKKKWQAEMEILMNHNDSLRGRSSRVALKICKKNSRNLLGANQVTVQAITCRDMMDASRLRNHRFMRKVSPLSREETLQNKTRLILPLHSLYHQMEAP